MKAIHDLIAQLYDYDDGIFVVYYTQFDLAYAHDNLYGLAQTSITCQQIRREAYVTYHQDKVTISAREHPHHHIPLADPEMINKMINQISLSLHKLQR